MVGSEQSPFSRNKNRRYSLKAAEWGEGESRIHGGRCILFRMLSILRISGWGHGGGEGRAKACELLEAGSDRIRDSVLIFLDKEMRLSKNRKWFVMNLLGRVCFRAKFHCEEMKKRAR